MTNRIQFREVVAWTTLIVAIILLSVSITFAQTKTVNINNENGKVHLQMTKSENGKTIKIDTTFSVSENENIDKIVDKIIGDNDGKADKDSKQNLKKTKKKIVIDYDSDKSKEDMEDLHKELEESMKSMHDDLKDMSKSLKRMHIQINDGDIKDLDFDIHASDFDDGNFSYSYSTGDSDEDINIDDEHIIIKGKEGEEPPVLEKVIEKNGDKIFVYKRSQGKGNSKGEGKSSSHDKKILPELNNLRVYPNPATSKIKIEFNVDKSSDLKIQLFDSNSKEVFSEKLKDFNGTYSKEVNLSGMAKGNYLLKISSQNKTMSLKVIVE
jgi:hypothetical protein